MCYSSNVSQNAKATAERGGVRFMYECIVEKGNGSTGVEYFYASSIEQLLAEHPEVLSARQIT